jgi:stage V sporulation protein SpoVS
MRNWPMRVAFVLLVMWVALVVTVFPSFAQTANPGDSVRWDFSDADLAASSVVRFEVCYDAALPCPSFTPAAAKFSPTAVQGGAPASGSSAYKGLLPALTTGAHNLTVKACSTAVCGGVAGPLGFSLVIIPGLPVNLQIIKG